MYSLIHLDLKDRYVVTEITSCNLKKKEIIDNVVLATPKILSNHDSVLEWL